MHIIDIHPQYSTRETLYIKEPLEYLLGMKFFGLGEISMIFVFEILATNLFFANQGLDLANTTQHHLHKVSWKHLLENQYRL